MSPDQITGILRALLAGVGGFILNKGWIDAETWQWLVGGVLMAGPMLWAWFKNKPSAIAASAQNLQGVTVTTNASAGTEVIKAVANAKVA